MLTPEVRMQEMVSMGIGSKPFMDIKPSDAAISDRFIDYIMKGSGELFISLAPILSPVCLTLRTCTDYTRDYLSYNHVDTKTFFFAKTTETWPSLKGVFRQVTFEEFH